MKQSERPKQASARSQTQRRLVHCAMAGEAAKRAIAASQRITVHVAIHRLLTTSVWTVKSFPSKPGCRSRNENRSGERGYCRTAIAPSLLWRPASDLSSGILSQDTVPKGMITDVRKYHQIGCKIGDSRLSHHPSHFTGVVSVTFCQVRSGLNSAILSASLAVPGPRSF